MKWVFLCAATCFVLSGPVLAADAAEIFNPPQSQAEATAADTTQAAVGSAMPAVPGNAFTLTPQEVEKKIADALAAAGAGKEIGVRIIGPNHDAGYTYETPLSVQVKDLKFDAATGKWEAMLMFESEGAVLAPAKLAGRFEEVFAVPTLKTRTFAGDVITESDIIVQKLPASRVRKNTLMKAQDIIGRSPLRTISAGRSIRQDEIRQLPVVAKGNQVSMTYQMNNLHINALGEALEEGAVGDTIRIRNLTSNKVVHGTVEDKGTVRVSTPNTLAAAH